MSSAPAVVASWPAAIRADYRALRALDGNSAQQVIKGIIRLARHGGPAGAALRALHDERSLPQRQRTMAGVMFANLNRFSVSILGALLRSDQPYVARHAGLLLSQLGAGSKKTLQRAADAQGNARVAAVLRRYAAQAAKRPLQPAAMLEALHVLLAHSDPKKKKWAATVLAVSYAEAAERHLVALLHEAVATPLTRRQAALALVEGRRKDAAKLSTYAGRQHSAILRVAAAQQLATLGKRGRLALEKLADAAGTDPLKARFRALAQSARR